MRTENFVSFETGKLLEEKGFPINEFHKGEIGVFNGIAVSKITKEMVENEILSCIPQSAVMNWLRDVQNLHITIDPYTTTEGVMYTYKIYNLERYKVSLVKASSGFKNNERACEYAISDCLTNLI